MFVEQFLPLIVGFLLTTVAGGALGFFFQGRAWAHQHRVLLEQQEQERATQVFEEVSRLLDKRIYRMKRVHWALKRELESGQRSQATEGALEDYRGILFEWNDSINRNLALIQQYFGARFRDEFDYAIGSRMVDIGKELEAVSNQGATSPCGESGVLERRLHDLGLVVYHFNLEMIRALQSRKVGWLVAENRRSPDESGQR